MLNGRLHASVPLNVTNTGTAWDDGSPLMRIASVKAKALNAVMTRPRSPSLRKLAGIALILLLIVFWAAFVASMAQVVGRWPILLQAPFYLFMGIAWIIPLKPLVSWIETGRWNSGADPRN